MLKSSYWLAFSTSFYDQENRLFAFIALLHVMSLPQLQNAAGFLFHFDPDTRMSKL